MNAEDRKKIVDYVLKNGSYGDSSWYGEGYWSLFDISSDEANNEEVVEKKLKEFFKDLK